MTVDVITDRATMGLDEPHYDESDVPRFAAALLHAGPEPDVDKVDLHMKWQHDLWMILSQKYTTEPWNRDMDELVWDDDVAPDQYSEWLAEYRNAKSHELRAFYTWLCKSRGDQWDRTIANGTLAFM